MFYSNKSKDRAFSAIDRPILGRTLPSLLDEACERHPNHRAFNQWKTNAWQSYSSQELQAAAEDLALGLLGEQLSQGDRVALLMHSDLNWCLADFGSLLAGLVNVPIDLTQTLDNIAFILRHSAAKALIVSDLDLLAQIIPYLWNTPNLQTIIIADIPEDWEAKRTQLLACEVNNKSSELLTIPNPKFPTLNFEPKAACLCIPMLLCQARRDLSCPELPQCIQLFSLDEVRARGRELRNQKSIEELPPFEDQRSRLAPQDLATIVYIAGDTEQPRGVMLSHENITADVLTTFKSIPDLKPKDTETVLSFLPLTHIFARALIYGHLNYGHNIYFSTPNRAARDFRTVKPTLVATVPRLLEKSYQKILDRGSKLRGIKKTTFNWALKLAQNYQLGQPRRLSYALQLRLADWLVFSQWRKPFGGRLKYFISGGAPLKAELANVFSAAGMTVLQGYGLTETSSVICCNRNGLNRAGTVGLPIPGVEIAIASDGEILVKAPYVMQGYYLDPEATKTVIDNSGWLHTGDLGEFTPEGFLVVTGSKKNLFKLSTGKYVIPQPLEDCVRRSPLVRQAVVVGMQQKFCGMLIFPDLQRLQERARALNLRLPITELLQQPEIVALYQAIVDEANEQLPRWSRVKQFGLLNADFTLDNQLLHPSLKINRAKVNEVFATEIDALYVAETVVNSQFGVVGSGLTDNSKLRLPKFEAFLSHWRHKIEDFWQNIGSNRKGDRSSQLLPNSDEGISN
ncbi:long-chain fatty acid--CoA ligase [Pleurocapsales cyanobacterium LEGE 10410]|nr:long-chain fatty acid--CoA ligase [Pleurocapsales cyanobacterium LEGE 10410]